MAPRKGNRCGSGGDPPNGNPKILPSPDLPGGGKVPVRRLQLGNKMQVFLVSTLLTQSDISWITNFPLLSNSFRFPSHTLGDASRDGVTDILSFSGGKFLNNAEENNVESQCNFSVVIGTGFTSDPNNYQGMAHFLEHIVHHGSAKYPEERSLLNFLCNNDGDYNAFTDYEVTGYHCDFKFSSESLRLALDMYADLLINPKVDIDFIQKEVHSIENELHLRRCSDLVRINQLINTLGIPGDHPLNFFDCGSLATLFPSSRTAQELRTEILKFHQAYYRPDNMALVVQAPVSLDMLQNYVMETFGSIQRSNPNIKSRGISKSLINPYSIKAFNKLITIKPGNRDIHTLVIHWAFPPEAWKDYKGKPMQYIAEVLSNNHPGGLHQFLLTREWVLEVVAGTDPAGKNCYCNEYTTMFLIIISLTQKGRDELSDVLEAVFAYIRFLREDGVKKSIFEKLKATSEAMFRSFPLGNSVDDSSALAKHLLLNYEMKHLITGGTLYFKYNPGTIKKYLNELKPEKACFVLVTADTGNLEYMTEEWYGAKYIVQDLEHVMLKKFQTGNRFTSQFNQSTNQIDVDKLCKTETDSSIPEYYSKMIRMSTHLSCFYNPIRPIETPQSGYIITILSNLTPKLAHSKAPAFQVFAKLWKLRVEKKSQYLNQLGTNVMIVPKLHHFGFRLEVVGFNLVANEVVKTFIDDFFNTNMDEKEDQLLFEIAKQSVLHHYYEIVAQPYLYAMDLYQRIKYVDNLSAVECYDELKKMTYQDFHLFIQQFFKSKLRIRTSVIGAATEAEAVELCQHLESKDFPRTGVLDMMFVWINRNWNRSEIKTLQMGERCLRMKSILPNEKPFVLLNYYQMDRATVESISITSVITTLLEDTVMYELRYKEQLGYALLTYMVSDARNGICILVMANSDRHSICHIDSRIENSIKTFFKDKLTRENLLPHIKAYNIKRDPAYIQEYARKYLLDKGSTSKEAGYRKLSVQVCHENLHNKCRGNCCHHSKWLIPLFHVGKENAEICVAGPSKPTNQKAAVYFIESAEAFHKYARK